MAENKNKSKKSNKTKTTVKKNNKEKEIKKNIKEEENVKEEIEKEKEIDENSKKKEYKKSLIISYYFSFKPFAYCCNLCLVFRYLKRKN